MADAVLGDAVPVSPDIGSFFKLPGADNEPAAAHIFAYTVNVEATDKKPAHMATKYKCLICNKDFVFSSWVRVRGHLSGDGPMALRKGPFVHPVREIPANETTPTPRFPPRALRSQFWTRLSLSSRGRRARASH